MSENLTKVALTWAGVEGGVKMLLNFWTPCMCEMCVNIFYTSCQKLAFYSAKIKTIFTFNLHV